jgi:PAS domain S-box-containing protein
MTPTDNRIFTARKSMLPLSLVVAAIGLLGLAGWWLDVAALKSVVPGSFMMTPNTAIGLLIDGLALAALSRERAGKYAMLFAVAAACCGIVFGALSLGGSLMQWDFGINQWLVRKSADASESSNTMRTTPSAAFCFLLAGFAMIFASRGSTQSARTPIVAALSVTIAIVGGLVLSGYASRALIGVSVWSHSGMAVHTAAGLVLLALALLAWARTKGRLIWSLDTLTGAGFAAGIISILVAAEITFGLTHQLQQDSSLVAHSQEVLKEIQELETEQRDLTLSLGRYIITGDESAVSGRPQIEASIREDLDRVRRLTVNDPAQQRSLETLAFLTTERVALSQRILADERQHRIARSSASRQSESPLGKEYPEVGRDIDGVLKAMESAEFALLQQSLAASTNSAARTFLLMPLGAYLSIAILLLGMFSLNAGTSKHKELEAYFGAIFDVTPDGILLTDSERKIVTANSAAEKMFGYARGTLIGVRIENLLPAMHRQDFAGEREGLLENAGIQPIGQTWETNGKRSDGSTFPIEIRRSALQTPRGKFVVGVGRDISERNRAETELRVREQRLRLFFDHAPVALAMFDPNMRYLHASRRWLDDYAIGARDVTGLSHYELFPEIPERWREVHRRALAGEVVRAELDPFQRVDGSVQWIRWEVRPWLLLSGDIGGILIFSEDLTELQRGQEAIRETRDRMAAIIDASLDAIVSVDDNERVIVFNNAAAEMFQLPSDQAIGEALSRFIPERFREIHKTHLKEFAERGMAVRQMGEFSKLAALRADGTEFRIEAAISLVNAGGRRLFTVTLRDISKRLQTEAALRASEAFNVAVLDSLPDNIAVLNQTGEIVGVNQAWKTFAMNNGAPKLAQNYLGTNYLEICSRAIGQPSGDEAPLAEGGLREVLAGERTAFQLEYPCHSPDKKRWFRMTATPLRNAHPGAVLRHENITARKQAEAAHAALEAQLLQSQKMEAIGTLAGGIAHDFNNMIAAIMGNADLAREDAIDNARVIESVTEIHKAAARARNLVQQILSFSRRQSPERKPIALAATVNEAARLLRSTLPSRIALEVQIQDDVPLVLADSNQIEQVLLNLATNSMQAMRDRPGQIRLNLGKVTLDPELVATNNQLSELHDKYPGTTVRLGVTDDGPGMDAETLARIFEPFFTTKPPGEGTGLGLSVVHGIVRAHDGAIVVLSEPGKGTDFELYLPAAEGAVEALVHKKAAVTSAPESRRVLYIDDDDALVFLFKRMLERRGYRITAHTSQLAALDELRANPCAFDLVVSDYNMPNMSGLEVAREVHKINATLPVAVASGYIDDNLRAIAHSFGVAELIDKAIDIDEFVNAVHRLAQDVVEQSPRS